MQRKSITRYDYISSIVQKIKRLQSKGESVDWYFNKLIEMYSPLIYKTCKKIRSKIGSTCTLQEVKARVYEMLFDAVLRYDNDYTNSDIQSDKTFSGVYFSRYLKSKLSWDIYRSINPPKPDYDDLSISPKYVELDFRHDAKIREKFVYNPVAYLSDNFISLCRLAQKHIKDDEYSDVMLLCYGYDYKIQEMAKMLGCQPKKITMILSKLKQFWSEKENKERLVE